MSELSFVAQLDGCSAELVDGQCIVYDIRRGRVHTLDALAYRVLLCCSNPIVESELRLRLSGERNAALVPHSSPLAPLETSAIELPVRDGAAPLESRLAGDQQAWSWSLVVSRLAALEEAQLIAAHAGRRRFLRRIAWVGAGVTTLAVPGAAAAASCAGLLESCAFTPCCFELDLVCVVGTCVQPD